MQPKLGHVRSTGAARVVFLFVVAFLAVAGVPGSRRGVAPARAAAPPSAAPFTVSEGRDEIRIDGPGYSLSVSRDGFAWVLHRGGATVLESAPADGPAANGALIVEGIERAPGPLRSVERAGDRV